MGCQVQLPPTNSSCPTRTSSYIAAPVMFSAMTTGPETLKTCPNLDSRSSSLILTRFAFAFCNAPAIVIVLAPDSKAFLLRLRGFKTISDASSSRPFNMPPKAFVSSFYDSAWLTKSGTVTGRNVCRLFVTRLQNLTTISDEKKEDGKDEEKIVGTRVRCYLSLCLLHMCIIALDDSDIQILKTYVCSFTHLIACCRSQP